MALSSSLILVRLPVLSTTQPEPEALPSAPTRFSQLLSPARTHAASPVWCWGSQHEPASHRSSAAPDSSLAFNRSYTHLPGCFRAISLLQAQEGRAPESAPGRCRSDSALNPECGTSRRQVISTLTASGHSSGPSLMLCCQRGRDARRGNG